jgi:hypothetical protein
LVNDELYTDGSGQMDDDVALEYQLINERLVKYRALNETKVSVMAGRVEVRQGSC